VNYDHKKYHIDSYFNENISESTALLYCTTDETLIAGNSTLSRFYRKVKLSQVHGTIIEHYLQPAFLKLVVDPRVNKILQG